MSHPLYVPARLHRKPLPVVLAALFSCTSLADTGSEKPSTVVITAPANEQPGLSASRDGKALAAQRNRSSDTARLLDGIPGVALSGAGGVSSLPVIQGLADDRNRIRVDGLDLISACANHMNPPLSYLDPSQVGRLQVYSGIAPVSAGGDRIGGIIVVESPAPRFADAGERLQQRGELGAFYRSNGDARGLSAAASLAGEQFYAAYRGSSSESDNYRAAKGFKPDATLGWTRTGTRALAADEVGSSAYKSENHQLNLAWQGEGQLIDLRLGWQHIPYQGFPNQHMDMTDNRSTQARLAYKGRFGWGTLEARLYQENTRHAMDFDQEKLYWYGGSHNVAGMPMQTKGQTLGGELKAEFALDARNTLRAGGEFQRYRLDDWWPPVANSMMMSPNTFWNIRHGRRDRLEAFAEWEARPERRWLTVVGLRLGRVSSDADPVQGYNTMAGYATDAARFNAADRSRSNAIADLSLLARFTPDDTSRFEGGYARKMRAPSLYERYTWSTNGMAVAMNNWVNDGNGYVGDLGLKPEIAHTLSLSANWHDAGRARWEIGLTPYFTVVEDYINAVCLTTCVANRYNALKLVNHNARLYGLDLSGRTALGRWPGVGDISAQALVSYTHGEDTRSGDALYNIMPLNARLALEARDGAWTHRVESQLVSAKQRVSIVRNEIKTGGYGLINFSTRYEAARFAVDLGIDNILNKAYAPPLGGAYIGQGATMSLNGAGAPYGIPVPGMGRSAYAAFTLKF